jgi:twitching motility protein PilT
LRLVPRSDGEGRVPATEIMIATETVKEYLIDSTKTLLLKGIIEESVTEYGMQTFDQSLLAWYNEGAITLEEAIHHASSPTALQIKAKGIQSGSDIAWTPMGAE